MIVRSLGDGGLLCIHQTSHAAMAAVFCRHWGNQSFARPDPYDAVMLGIAQHDNGWYEWEQRPRLRADGYPMDFVHDADPLGKLALWRRGVERLYAQHPYAGLLLARHAALLYGEPAANGQEAEIDVAIRQFTAWQTQLADSLCAAWAHDKAMQAWLRPSRIDANTRLLQFGDTSSLQVLMPWGSPRTIHNCPVDFEDTYTTIDMTFDGDTITYEPWPFGVDAFEVSIHGRLLAQDHFADPAAYHAALAAAPFQRLTWRVVRSR